MKTRVLLLVILAGIMVSCVWFEKPKYPVVGRWSTMTGHYAEFKNNKKFYLKEEQHQVTGEGEEKHYFHHYEEYYGMYTVSEDIVTFHYTEIQYKDAEIYHHEYVLDTTRTIPPFEDEIVKYELDEYGDQLTLVRHFGTDSAQTFVYYRQYYK